MAQARSEPFYRVHGVPDTIHGRFEMVVLHLALMLMRLEAEGEDGQETGRPMLEAFVADMDDACRRLGIGDMGVPRHVNKAAAAVLERSKVYRAAMIADADGRALAAALSAAIWEAPDTESAGAGALAAYVRRAVALLEKQDGTALLGGMVDFPEVEGPKLKEHEA